MHFENEGIVIDSDYDICINRQNKVSTFKPYDGKVTIPFDNYNYIVDVLYCSKTGKEISAVADNFPKYSTEYDYVKDNFIQSKVRSISGLELFYFTFCHLLIEEVDSYRTGVFISILSYRMSENEVLRLKYIEEIANYKDSFDKVISLDEYVNCRWFVSSAAALSICLLAEGKVVRANRIINRLLSKSYAFMHIPVTYWNVILCMQLKGLILYSRNNFKGACSILDSSYVLSSTFSNQISSPSNPWLVSQLHDARTISELGRQAFLLSKHIGAGENPIFVSQKALEIPKADLSVLLKRFPKIKESHSSKFFLKMFYSINNGNKHEQ